MGRSTRVALGRVVGADGLEGQIRVRLLGERPEHLLRATSVALGIRPEDPVAPACEVIRSLPGRRGEVRMALAGVRRREEAEALQGRYVLVDAALLDELPPGEYYRYQLIGCEVLSHQGQRIGTVREVWETGAHDVLVVDDEQGRQHLLPAAEDLLREVNVEQGRIVIEVIPGLLDPA
jgi:16S rRNA processing protein RimM